MSVTPASGTETARPPLLSARGIVKSFGPVRAVDGVDLDVYEREVVGIIGDNGAGKSTFLSLLTGFNQLDAGRLFYRGRPVAVRSPHTARRDLKIEMIYQRLELAPDLTVWENLFLGEEERWLGVFSRSARMRERARDVLREMNTKIRATDIVGELSGGEQQVVAIARAILFDREVVIMDEPTAAISVQKVEDVLKLIRRLRETGKSVLLVSHRLDDLIAVCDRIVVFYHGTIRTVLANKDLAIADLVHAMF
ncbi:ATP-binding cassette domain-containing protein [Acidiphilium sp.]|uniref:ATP-binding cassette domain-containing protein n=1 Tax=Acidiphilium sp. TaxID=527 RepID=UPI002583C32A|nr:ATP-binding cassette domain-containing protein [Acidiphilium sp.]